MATTEFITQSTNDLRIGDEVEVCEKWVTVQVIHENGTVSGDWGWAGVGGHMTLTDGTSRQLPGRKARRTAPPT